MTCNEVIRTELRARGFIESDGGVDSRVKLDGPSDAWLRSSAVQISHSAFISLLTTQ